jgi:hypothetical protein
MQNVADYLEGDPEGRKWLYGSILPLTPKVKNSNAKKVKSSPEALNVTSLSLKDDKQLCSQAEYQLSTIFDPLWKKICFEVGRMMGPFAVVKLGVCQLGDLSSENSTLDLYCPTEETVAFAQQCGFVILGEIQQYFPKLKELKIRRKIQP